RRAPARCGRRGGRSRAHRRSTALPAPAGPRTARHAAIVGRAPARTRGGGAAAGAGKTGWRGRAMITTTVGMLHKYPRTPHIEGSRLQPGDHDLAAAPFAEIAGRYLVVEEKLDGANAGISFTSGGRL